MTLQIIILNTNTQSDGSFYISGVFWLTAPSNNIVKLPDFQSQVPFIDQTNLTLLQNGVLVEQPFGSGLFAAGTALSDVQSALESQFAAAQTTLNNTATVISGLIGSNYNGTSWSNSSPFAPSLVTTKMVLPNILPDNTQLCFPGAGDDPVNGIGKGTLFQHSSNDTSPTTHTITWQFNDWTYLSGGHIIYSGAVVGDTVNYYVYAAATAVTTVSGTGNVNCVGPGNVLIIPGANTNSQVDLTKAVPVPSLTNTGFWDWAPPSNGVGYGTIVPNTNQTGGFNLYAMNITLGEFVLSYPMLGSNYIDLTVPAILPKKILPQWTHKVEVNNSGHSGLEMVWALTIARVTTIGM